MSCLFFLIAGDLAKMEGSRQRSVASVYQRPPPRATDEQLELSDRRMKPSDRRMRWRGGSHRRQPHRPSTPPEEVVAKEDVAATDDDEELVRQTDEVDRGLHQDDEDEPVGTGSASAGSSRPYLRGPSSLPPVPLPHQRPVLHPEGQKLVILDVITTTSYDMLKMTCETNKFSSSLVQDWVVVLGTASQYPNGVMGLLCKQHYPGLVEFHRKELAYLFDHYVIAADAEYPNKVAWVIAEFWVSLPRTTLLNTSH
jgi:hypothetical protein